MSRGTLARTGLNLLLLMLLAVTAAVQAHVKAVDRGHGFGGDFIQFYVAGTVVNRGQADRLYDQEYFCGTQQFLVGHSPPQYSLYPPTVALAMAPLARLPYPAALGVWWTAQAACFALVGWVFYRTMAVAAAWRAAALLALAGMYPVWVAVMSGHLTAVLLLVLAGGLALHYRDRRLTGGLVLSLCAIKPQLAAGVLLWLLLRRDLRAGVGMALGGAIQLLAVALWLGPAVLGNYLKSLPTLAGIIKQPVYAAHFEQSLHGIVANLLRKVGEYPGSLGPALLAVQAIVAILTGFFLLRSVRYRRGPLARAAERSDAERYEHAAVVLFALLATPYLLVYDLTLLAVPIVELWSSPAWRLGVALYASLTLVFAVVYLWIGFSLVPLLALLALYRVSSLSQSDEPRRKVRQELLPCALR